MSGGVRGALGWVDPRFGPILEIQSGPLTPPDPDWWLTNCRLVRNVSGLPGAVGIQMTSGIALDPGSALDRALGEAIERYSALNVRAVLDPIVGPPIDLELARRFPTCDPREPAPPSFFGVDRRAAITQVRVRRLIDDGVVHVPIGHVDLSFHPGPSEPAVTLPISTGYAFHPERHIAAGSGLCEVAERDALMIHWWTRRVPPRVVAEPARASGPLGDRLDRLRRAALELTLMDFTLDFPAPTVVAALRGGRSPAIGLGSGCHFDPAIACIKAIDEAVSYRLSARSVLAKGVPRRDRSDWVLDLEDHVRFYADGAMVDRMPFLSGTPPERLDLDEFASKHRRRAPADFSEVRALAGELADLELTALWCEATAPEAGGFGHVIKAIIPEMVPLSPLDGVRWLATERLRRFARRGPSSDPEIETLPHPFA